jgi:hypothetical protein
MKSTQMKAFGDERHDVLDWSADVSKWQACFSSVFIDDVKRFTEINQSTTTHDAITQELKFRRVIWRTEGKDPGAQ